MSEEQTAPVEQAVDTSNLQAELEAMRKKNAELLDEYKKAVKQAKAVPEGVDIDELIQFKRQAEQQQLESQGKYSEARQALEQQFREATAEKDQRISELESRVRELELLTPAVSALADIVHDPDLVMKTKLSPDQIEREPDGTVVVWLTATSAHQSRNGQRPCLAGCKNSPNHRAVAHPSGAAVERSPLVLLTRSCLRVTT